jgi:hypothetical protein
MVTPVTYRNPAETYHPSPADHVRTGWLIRINRMGSTVFACVFLGAALASFTVVIMMLFRLIRRENPWPSFGLLLGGLAHTWLWTMVARWTLKSGHSASPKTLPNPQPVLNSRPQGKIRRSNDS